MKTTVRKVAAIFCPLLLSVLCASPAHAQSEAITVDKIQYNSQTAASTVTPQLMPYSLVFNIRGSAAHSMANWGPAFYIPGSGGTPQSGASSATNTGTLNFSAAPNNGGDFAFIHDFSSAGELATAYPAGAYGVKFLGSNPPTPAEFTAALAYQTGAFPATAPQITSVNNGATWSDGKLILKASGTTTLTFNSFPEYGSSTNGALIGLGIYSSEGVIDEASIEDYDLPTLGHHDPASTQVSINGAWLSRGITYTLELQYAVIASPPQEGNLTPPGAGPVNFQGLSTYRKNTVLMVEVAGEPAGDDFDGDGMSDTLWRNSNTGDISSWPSAGGYKSFGREASGWSFIGRGDFDGDGKVDTLWRNSNNGTIASWPSASGYTVFGVEGSGWAYIDLGDFDGDGKADTLWRNANTGDISSWPSAGGYKSFGREGSGWSFIGRGDFDGDGKVDTLWRNSNNGTIASWPSAGGYTNFGVEGSGWAYIDHGDFDGDGKVDTLWRNSNNGTIASWPSAGGYKAFGVEGAGWAYIDRSDFDGDGKVDTLWRNANTGDISSWPSAGGYKSFGREGSGWSFIDLGDYDGDGKVDTLWRNANNGTIASWPSAGGYKVFGVEGGGWSYLANSH
jgi:hypothetical protein